MAIAKTLSGILENEVVQAALDRRENIDYAIQEMQERWNINLWDRNPSPTYSENGNGREFAGSDLDAFTVLKVLKQRGAVIDLPNYSNQRPQTDRTDQRVVSSHHRHGKLAALVSNRETHSFSVLLYDHNVIQDQPGEQQTVGACRAFSILDDFACFHAGFEGFEFDPTNSEREFFEEKGVEFQPGSLNFRYFVHPSKAGSFLGEKKIATEILIARLADEIGHYRSLAKHLRESGIKLGGSFFPDLEYDTSVSEDKVSYTGQVLESKVTIPGFLGSYPLMGESGSGKVTRYNEDDAADSQHVLRYAEHRVRDLRRARRDFQADAKAVDTAFFLNAIDETGAPIIRLGWSIPEAGTDYRIPTGDVQPNGRRKPMGRKLWYAYHLTDPIEECRPCKDGDGRVSVLYRIVEKTVQRAR